MDRLWFDGTSWRVEERLDNDYLSVAAVGSSGMTDRCWAARASGGVDLIYKSGSSWVSDTYLSGTKYIDISRKYGNTSEFFGVTDGGRVDRIYSDNNGGYIAEHLAQGDYISVTGYSAIGGYDTCWAVRKSGGVDLIQKDATGWKATPIIAGTRYTDINANNAGDGSFYGVTDSGLVDRIYQSSGNWLVQQRVSGDYTCVAGINVAGYYDRCLAALKNGGLVEMIPMASGFELTRRTFWGTYADMEPVPGEWQPFAVTALAPQVDMLNLKDSKDGDPVSFTGVVTGVFSDFFYVGSTDRSNGIRVNKLRCSISGDDLNSTVRVTGRIRSRVGEERAVDAGSIEYLSSITDIRPLAMTNKTLETAAEVHKMIQQWGVLDQTFTSSSDYSAPYTSPDFYCIFTGPNNESYNISGFWDGGRTWKIRFAPTSQGEWTYTTYCSDTSNSGLHNKTGKFTVVPTSSTNPIYKHGGFLKVSSNKRYLTYLDGTPFFWLGDTWWFCPSPLVPFDYSSEVNTPSAYKTMINKRKNQGYTTVQMAFMTNPGGSGVAERFRSSSIDNIYFWRDVDRYMQYANDAGIIPVMGLTFHTGMNSATLDEWKTVWRYVIARYGSYAVLWIVCGEYNQNNVPDIVNKALALGQFIKDRDPFKRAMSIHPWWYGGEGRQAWDQPWYDYIMFQGAHEPNPPSVSLYYDTYNRPSHLPLLEAECRYEGIRNFTAADVRLVAYRAIQSGSFGYTYGSHGLWYPNQNPGDQTFAEWGTPVPWWTALDREGGSQMQYLKTCYESVEWWKLEPRPDAVTTPMQLDEMKRILTKSEADKVFVIYFPAGSRASTDAVLHGGNATFTYSAQWFNPRTSAKTNLSNLSMPDGTCHLPSRPDEEDWILIINKA